MIQPIRTYNVTPKLPEAIEPLREIAFNLWWTWEPEARALFHQIDPELWNQTNHNPLRMLQLARQARLTEVAQDDDFLHAMRKVQTSLREYLKRPDTWGKTRPQDNISPEKPVAYFSAEFGFHESFPNYSGGLGILSGDHAKSASDLDLPFYGLTLLYKGGYFTQRITKEGWQESIALNQNFSHLPISEAKTADGKPVTVVVDILGRQVTVKVWTLAVGRIKLLLLDTDTPENNLEDRGITSQLYGGDHEIRIKQEIVLGIGGVMALRAMNITPACYHMNEGHSAFLSLELIRRVVVENKLDFYSALQVVAAANIFTTHTPVPAGNDAFSLDLMHRYFGSYPAQVGIDFETFASFGQNRKDPHEPFSMTILALRTSRHANGVSRLHGQVSQTLWKDVWAGVPENEVPITSITNGIHTKTWIAPDIRRLFDKYLGNWEENLTNREFWNRVFDIPDEDLWNTHQAQKVRMIEFIRDRVRKHRTRLGEAPESIRHVNRLLNPEVLSIGFARRFATYKRATLIFSDLDRLLKILNHPERPVQLVFAGKAHPKDQPGKDFIRRVYEVSRIPEFTNRVVFVEDYDHYVGRRLYQGCDLWLNNPRRPLEASGTSGMKLPPNGGLNLSVLDGWWCEGYNRKNGWAIGAEIPENTKPEEDPNQEDAIDIASLFHVLETQIVPLYYAKPDGRLPLAWIQLMRESIRSITPEFNTNRMVTEYTERLYEGAAKAHAALAVGNGSKAVELSRWKDTVRKYWPEIQVRQLNLRDNSRTVLVGDKLPIDVQVQLGRMQPEHVIVQAYFGEVEPTGGLKGARTVDLKLDRRVEGGDYIYTGEIPADDSGSYGLNVRVIPTHPHLIQAHELRLITWAP